MRITGGIFAGRRLRVPKGRAVRPTPDVVKQAVFNSLGTTVVGADVLELFAGSGALGLECLSRGASGVVAVEKAPHHTSVIRNNLRVLGLTEERLELICQDVFSALRWLREAGRTFHLVLADPPFGEKNVGRRSGSLSQALLDDSSLPALLAQPDGMLVLGHSKRDSLCLPSPWREFRLIRHGDSVMRFLRPERGASASAP